MYFDFDLIRDYIHRTNPFNNNLIYQHITK